MNLFLHNHAQAHRKALTGLSWSQLQPSMAMLRPAGSGRVAVEGSTIPGGILSGSYSQPCRASEVGTSTLRGERVTGFGKNPQEDR